MGASAICAIYMNEKYTYLSIEINLTIIKINIAQKLKDSGARTNVRSRAREARD